MAQLDPIWIMATAAGIQAVMATLLWWQGRSLGFAAQQQAAASIGTHNLVVEASVASSATLVKESLKAAGYNEHAWEIERAVFEYVSRIRDDPEDMEGLNQLRQVMLEGLHLVLRKEQADRLGNQGE